MNGEAAKEKLVGDLKTLIGDAEELLKASATQAGEKFSVARQKIATAKIVSKMMPRLNPKKSNRVSMSVCFKRSRSSSSSVTKSSRRV